MDTKTLKAGDRVRVVLEGVVSRNVSGRFHYGTKIYRPENFITLENDSDKTINFIHHEAPVSVELLKPKVCVGYKFKPNENYPYTGEVRHVEDGYGALVRWSDGVYTAWNVAAIEKAFHVRD